MALSNPNHVKVGNNKALMNACGFCLQLHFHEVMLLDSISAVGGSIYPSDNLPAWIVWCPRA